MMTENEEQNAAQERNQKLNDAVKMINWLRANPEVPLPFNFEYGDNSIYEWDSKEQAQRMARLMGTFEKSFDKDFLKLKKRFGTMTLEAVFSRGGVCERVVTGTQEIPETVVPAKVEPARTVEIVEWHCPKLLEPDDVSEQPNAQLAATASAQ